MMDATPPKHSHRHPMRRCWPVTMWPDADQRCRAKALAPGTLFDDAGHGTHLAPASLEKIAKGYGRWLHFLSSQGLLDPDSAPGDRVNPNRVAAYVTELRTQVADTTIVNRLEELALALKIMVPEMSWSWINQVIARIRRTAVPAPDKHALVQHSAELLGLGLQLMESALEGPLRLRSAERYRDGLIIATLAATGLRRRNLVAIEIGRHLVTKSDEFWLHFDSCETKNRQPCDMPLPMQLAPYILTYLERIRPFLLSRGGRVSPPQIKALWVSEEATAMRGISIYFRIRKHTKAAFGHPANPHLFRDCRATSIAIDDPSHIGAVSTLLGHRRRRTTEKYYNLAGSLEAGRRVAATILALRGEGTAVVLAEVSKSKKRNR